MALVYAPDFVVQRKRKRSRRAVDPCLGFYRESVLSDEAESPPKIAMHTPSRNGPHMTDVIVNDQAVSSPDKRRIPSPPAAQSGRCATPSVTVEDFLRKTPLSTKRYTRHGRDRKGQKARVGDPAEHFSDDGRDPDYSESPTAHSSPHPRKGRRPRPKTGRSSQNGQNTPARSRKKAKPLSARILSAAVLTGVVVGPSSVLPSEPGSSRRPLPFTAANRAPSPVDTLVCNKRRHFVDPRKAVSFDRSAFVVATAPEASSLAQTVVLKRPKSPRPITAWTPYTLGVSGGPSEFVPRATTELPPANRKPLVMKTAASIRPPQQTRTLPVRRGQRGGGRARDDGRGDAPKLQFEANSERLPRTHQDGAATLDICAQTSFFVPDSSPRRSPASSTGVVVTSPISSDDKLPGLVLAADRDALRNSMVPSSTKGPPPPASKVLESPALHTPPSQPTGKHFRPLGSFLGTLRDIARSATRQNLLASERNPGRQLSQPRAPPRAFPGASRSAGLPRSAPSLGVLVARDGPSSPKDSVSLRRLRTRLTNTRHLIPDPVGISGFLRRSVAREGGDPRCPSVGIEPSLLDTGASPYQQRYGLENHAGGVGAGVFLPSSPLPTWSALHPTNSQSSTS